MRWRDLPVVAFDTETTGFNPEEGHRVMEFGAVEYRLAHDGSVTEVLRHSWLFNPGGPIPREIQDITGIHDEDVANKPAFSTRAVAIHKLLAGAVTIAHNYPFDQRFLTHEFSLCGLTWPCPPAEIDTSDLSRQFFKEAREHKLGSMAARLEVPLVQAHRATDDAEACGRSFLAMVERFNAPELLPEMIDWADGIGGPPDTGHLVRDADGVIVFGEGKHSGAPAASHPETLAWMGVARERTNGRWDWRYPEPVRRWAARFLRIRGSGRFPQGMKGFGPHDWGIDPPAGSA